MSLRGTIPYSSVVQEPYVRKCAFDIGDYGFGNTANSLHLGCDCLGAIHYFDGLLSNSKGEPVTVPKVVCMHEEDVGLLWKHVEPRTGHNESRRSRRLVVSFISTVVNYEYAFYFYFYLDGTFEVEVKLTGELSTNVLSPGEENPEFGTLVLPHVNAQNHQHEFCVRIDPAIDDENGGKDVVITEVNCEPVPPGPKNPYANAFYAKEQPLLSVKEAQRDINPASNRVWKMTNPGCLNPITKKPVSYKLLPHASPPLMAHPDSITAKKGHFATKSLWVTPFSPDQRFPAGDFVFNEKACHGLSQWTKEDASLKGADPVVWYHFGVTHVVRIEDFPIMPVETVGFQLKPMGFFTGNPSVDVPPSCNKASVLVGSHNGCAQNGCAQNGAAQNGHAQNGHA
ncbi:copper amine oxidase [Dunaliella salina]|uniref:Amine oxidase n=1 Tax=Dunaliella salina TaxID=3046 RepID=A0ABQ7GI43_DUNSA|nr:copper amine oxidase [Dunaliella salina]|eukprot:KAF5834276.1 copper amine oxidase [Dunaliella salina]